MNNKTFRYDVDDAQFDCVTGIERIVETLDVVLDRIDALRADTAGSVLQRLLRIVFDAAWIADVLERKTPNEEVKR